MAYVLILTIHADPAMPPGYGEWGGTHTYMKELLDSLDDLDINCVLVTRRSMVTLPEVEQYGSRCTIYRLQNGNVAPINKTKLWEYHEQNLNEIQKIIQSCGETPLVIHSVYWNSGRLGVELSKMYNIPLVHSVISNSFGRQARGAKEPVPERAIYEQLIYDYAKWILCVSEDERNDLIHFYNIEPEKIIVAGQYIHPSFIMPSRDNDGFPRLNSNISAEAQKLTSLQNNDAYSTSTKDPFWAYKAFTYFGRIDESKGVDHILAAWYSLFKKYNSLCPPLWLIGGSIKEIHSMRTKCYINLPELLIAEQEGKVVWWGCIDSIGASTLLLKTLVLVTNSLYEPGGRVITEAMSEGVPVIAAPNGFALDLIHNWENGFLVAHGDENELAIRMEYFIRQPFLANALGENARQTAVNVVNDWDFIGKHLFAYGIKDSYNVSKKVPVEDYFCRREINLFPYRNLPLSNELLCDFFENSTGECIIEILDKSNKTGTSNIFHIHGERNNYIIKHPYTRLALGSLILPIHRKEYIRNELDFYKYEILSYEAEKSNILVAKDDFHHLILLRELETFVLSHERFPGIINFLSEQNVSISENTAKLYDDMLRNSDVGSLENIEILLDCLSERFPDFYFESSGTFSPYLGWKIAPYILDYNFAAFNEEEFDFLQTVCDSFSQKSELPLMSSLVEITGDICLQHILFDNGEMCLIDRERRTIGIVEYMIADILLDIMIQEIDNSSKEWMELLNNKMPKNCNCKQVVCSLAYKLFYRTILEKVMYRGSIKPHFRELAVLLDTVNEL